MWLLAAVLLFVAEPMQILALGDARPGAGMPPGWKLRAVRGQKAPDIEVREEGAERVLRVHGANRAAWFYRELSPTLSDTSGRLRWSWRVLEAPATADLRAELTDDSPIRVFVTFGKPGLFGRSARVIFYTYGNAEPASYARASYASDRLHVIRVDGASERGRWNEHIMNPFADYRRIWGSDAPAITAIGVMQDTEQTGAPAVAELRRLEWTTP